MMLVPIPIRPEQPVLASVAAALDELRGDGAALATMPTLTNIALGDPYLAQQLAELRARFELLPPAATGLLDRLRARVAWWLLGRELQQTNRTHAAVVRILDSLLVQLDQERSARRRIEEHLADLPPTPDSLPPHAPCPMPSSPVPSAHSPVSLVWHSSFAAPTGYSGSARAFVLGLAGRGVAVRPLYLYGTDRDEQVLMGQMHPRIRALQAAPVRLDVPQVVYAPGDRFCKNSGSYRIGFTMLEADRLPAAWVAQANQMHEVWTPSAWSRAMFQASGVQVPVHVVPLGVDTGRFVPTPQPRRHLAERTVLLSVFEWGQRKGWDSLLRAYAAAFRPTDPVLLLLKVDCRQPATNPLGELARLLPPNAPPVGVIYNQVLSGEQLTELYQAADCFVLPTRGEGWGMPILEAMACGVPAIATNWSAPPAFLSSENGYPLPIRGLVPTASDHPYYRAAHWADPDETALTDLLRHVVAHPAERQRKGQQARRDAERWTWDNAVETVFQRLQAIGQTGQTAS